MIKTGYKQIWQSRNYNDTTHEAPAGTHTVRKIRLLKKVY